MDLQRVALVARPAQGGIRSHLILLNRYLDEEFSPRLLAPQSLLDSLPEALAENATPLDVVARLSLTDLTRSQRLSRLLMPGEIVHAHGIRAGWISALARSRRRFPFVVTFHNIPPLSPMGKVAVAFITYRADRVIAVSQAIAAYLPKNKTLVIPNGIEIGRFQLGNRSEARASLQIDETRFVAGCIARLSREKGVDLLVKAAVHSPEILFVIVGDGPDRETLEKAAPSNVRFLGRLDDVAPALRAFDLLVIPSRSEGQGIVALEAFASGCPVIASRVGGLVETIEDAKTGLLIEPENPVTLKNAIGLLAANAPLRASLSMSAQASLGKRGSIERMCRSVEAAYRETLGMKG